MRKPILFMLALAAMALHCSSEPPRSPETGAVRAGTVARSDPAAPTALVDRIAAGTSRVYPVDTAAYVRGDQTELPIGVLDSDFGGLTVLDAILTLDEVDNRTREGKPDGVADFVDERFVYFADQANTPYEGYLTEGREDFLRELVVSDAAFLLGNRYWPSPFAAEPRVDKPRVKAIVVTTTTAHGIDDLRMALAAWKIPLVLVGGIEAGDAGVTMEEPGLAAGAAHDPAPARRTARELYRSLVMNKRLRDPARTPALEANAFFISTPNRTLADVKLTADGALDPSTKYGRKAGHFERETVRRVPMRPTDLAPEHRSLVQRSMPAVWSGLEGFQSSRLAR